jgi:hypothetical protein
MWEDYSDQLTWEPAPQFEEHEMLWLVHEFLHTCQNPGCVRDDIDSSSSESESSCDDDAGNPTTKQQNDAVLWCLVGKAKMSMTDRNTIQSAKPLDGKIMDICMWILAQQVDTFQFNTCSSPLRGYSNAIFEKPDCGALWDHIQVHFCGPTNLHWVTSFAKSSQELGHSSVKTRVWTFSTLQEPKFHGKVTSELTDLYFNNRDTNSYDNNIKVIPTEQKRDNSCGYLAIAFAVEVALGITPPEELYRIRFDEEKIHCWLETCIFATKFTLCPKVESIKRSHDNCGYNEILIHSAFIKANRSNDFNGQVYNHTDVGKSEINPATDMESYGLTFVTAPSQLGQLRLMKGCVIEFSFEREPMTKSTSDCVPRFGYWEVTNITTNGAVTIKSVPIRNNTWKGESHTLTPFALFRIFGPPILRVKEFLTVESYKLIPDLSKRPLRIVYPVNENRLANATFAQKDAGQYLILEMVRCEKSEDILTTFAVFAHKTVEVCTRIHDLLPWKPVQIFVNRFKNGRTIKNVKTDTHIHMYMMWLKWIAEKFNVTFLGEIEMLPNWRYDVLKAVNLPVTSPLKFQIHASMPHYSELLLPCDVVVDTGVSRHSKVFPMQTPYSSIQTWGERKLKCKFPSQQCERWELQMRLLMSDQVTIRTSVVNHVIVSQHVGQHTPQQPELLELAKKVVQTVRTFAESQHTFWNYYSFDVGVTFGLCSFGLCSVMYVGTCQKADITSMNEHWTTTHEHWITDGFMALGGNKLVLKGRITSPFNNAENDALRTERAVAIYRLRNQYDQYQWDIFKNDMNILDYIHQQQGSEEWCIQLVHRNTKLQDIAVVELMDHTLRGAIIKLNLSTYGEQQKGTERER